MSRIFSAFLMLIALNFALPQSLWAKDPYQAHDDEWFSSQSPESVRTQIRQFYEKFLEQKNQEAEEAKQAAEKLREREEAEAFGEVVEEATDVTPPHPRSDIAPRESFSIARTLSLMKDGLEFNQIIGEQIIVYHLRPELRDAVILLFQSIQTAVGPELNRDLHVSPMTKFAQGTWYTALTAYTLISLARGGKNPEKLRWYQLGAKFMRTARGVLKNHREILTVTGQSTIAGAILAVNEAWRTRKMDPQALLERAKREVLYKLGQKVAIYRDFLRQTQDGVIFKNAPQNFEIILAQIDADIQVTEDEFNRHKKAHPEFNGDQPVDPDQEDGPKIGLETIQTDLREIQARLPDAQMKLKEIIERARWEQRAPITEGRTPQPESSNNSPQERR